MANSAAQTLSLSLSRSICGLFVPWVDDGGYCADAICAVGLIAVTICFTTKCRKEELTYY